MAMLVEIGKRKWLAGMHWVTYPSVPAKDALLEDADRIATRTKNPIDVELIAIRQGKATIQAGFCDQPEAEEESGSKLSRFFASKKSYSLAARLADSTKQPWLGVFKLDEDLYWFIAVRDGNGILPDGDLIGTKDEIQAARDKYSGLNEDWDYVKGDRESLERLLDEVEGKPTQVKELPSGGIPWVPVCAGAVLIAAVGGVGWKYQQMKKEDRLRMEAELRKKVLMAQAAAPTGPTNLQLLQRSPSPAAWLDACKAAIYDVPLSFAGWDFSAVSCIDKQAVIIWKRSAGGTVDTRPAGAMDAAGDSVSEVKPLSVPGAADQSQVPKMQDAELQLQSWGQHRGIIIRLEPLKDESKTVVPTGQASVKTEPKKSVSFEVIAPFMFGGELAQLPGLRIVSAKPTQSYETNGRWIVEGVLYGS